MFGGCAREERTSPRSTHRVVTVTTACQPPDTKLTIEPRVDTLSGALVQAASAWDPWRLLPLEARMESVRGVGPSARRCSSCRARCRTSSAPVPGSRADDACSLRGGLTFADVGAGGGARAPGGEQWAGVPLEPVPPHGVIEGLVHRRVNLADSPGRKPGGTAPERSIGHRVAVEPVDDRGVDTGNRRDPDPRDHVGAELQSVTSGLARRGAGCPTPRVTCAAT